jgi:hypothetical protein
METRICSIEDHPFYDRRYICSTPPPPHPPIPHYNTVVLSPTEYTDYRVPGFQSSRPNWVPQTPNPQASVAHPPLGPGGGGDTLACGVGGGGTRF